MNCSIQVGISVQRDVCKIWQKPYGSHLQTLFFKNIRALISGYIPHFYVFIWDIINHPCAMGCNYPCHNLNRNSSLSKLLFLFNTLRLRQNGHLFPDDIFKWIFLNENVWISLRVSLKFVPKVRINNIPALVQIMAWRRPGDKPLSEPMTVSLLTHICVTRPQWVKLGH